MSFQLDKTMVEIVIRLFEDVEAELSQKSTPKKLKELGNKIRGKLVRAAAVVEILQKKGWKWTTGTKDIYLFKGISKEFAVKEIKDLKVDDIVGVDNL